MKSHYLKELITAAVEKDYQKFETISMSAENCLNKVEFSDIEESIELLHDEVLNNSKP